jgi:DNA-binding CsgD family transcriptional regulator
MSEPNPMAQRRHELLSDVEQTVADTARELGMADEIAQHLGAATADMLTDRWGGQQITFPMNGYYGLSPRELEIATLRDQGEPVWKLARQFEMTERGIRKLLTRVAARRATISPQAELFSSTDGG